MSKLLLTLAVLVAGSISFAGGGSVTGEGGGHGVLCSHPFGPNGSTYTLEVLDLYEYRNLRFVHSLPAVKYGMGELPSSATVCRILDRRKAIAEKVFGPSSETIPAFQAACDLAQHINVGALTHSTNDYGHLRFDLSSNCELTQLAIWRKVNGVTSVTLNQDVVLALGAEDYAALLLHEALHAYLPSRDTGMIRDYVGTVFGN